jgi:MFS family permease
MTLLIALAATTAVAAAVRSTWSPCGLSMLSTITPMAERSRGRRWGLTAAWFLLGALVGGATLGALAAVGAAGVALLQPSVTAALLVAAVVALAAAAADLGLGTRLPHHRRQVDEVWLDQYRSWVYGVGFGWQIGTGLATYIMTAGVYLTVVLGALSGRPGVAFGIGVLFGVVRGLAIFLGARLTDPQRLRSFHQRFDTAGPVVRQVVIGVILVVAVVAAGGAGGPVAAVAAVVAAGALVVGSRVAGAAPDQSWLPISPARGAQLSSGPRS